MWEKNAFFVRQRSYGQFFIYLFMSLFFYMFSFCEWRIVLAGKKTMANFLFMSLFFYMFSFCEWRIVLAGKKKHL
jgi:hypothetical protein